MRSSTWIASCAAELDDSPLALGVTQAAQRCGARLRAARRRTSRRALYRPAEGLLDRCAMRPRSIRLNAGPSRVLLAFWPTDNPMLARAMFVVTGWLASISQSRATGCARGASLTALVRTWSGPA